MVERRRPARPTPSTTAAAWIRRCRRPSTSRCQHALSFPQSTGTYVDTNGVPRTYVTRQQQRRLRDLPGALERRAARQRAWRSARPTPASTSASRNDIIVKNSEALFNVAGFEIENSDDADVFDNVAHCNTGGFLDLRPARPQPVRRRDAHLRQLLRLQQHRELRAGRRRDRRAAGRRRAAARLRRARGLRHTRSSSTAPSASSPPSHAAARRQHRQPRQAHGPLPRGIYIHDNVFTTNGTSPQPPRPGVIICARRNRRRRRSAVRPDRHQRRARLAAAGAGPDQGRALGRRLRPTGAHIVWDGMYDAAPYDCDLAPEFAGIVDANGKPRSTPAAPPGLPLQQVQVQRPDRIPATRRHPPYWMLHRRQRRSETATRSRPTAAKFMNFAEHRSDRPHPMTDINTSTTARRASAPRWRRSIAAVVEAYVPGRGRRAAADAGRDRCDLRRLRRQRPINRERCISTAQLALAVQLLRRPDRPAQRAPNEAASPFDLTTPLFSDYAGQNNRFVVPAARSRAPSGRKAAPSAPNATLDLPGRHRDRQDLRASRTAHDENVVETAPPDPPPANHGETLTGEGMPFIWDTDGEGQSHRRPHSAGRRRHQRRCTLELRGSRSRRDRDLRRRRPLSYADPARQPVRRLSQQRRRGPATSPIGLEGASR